MAEHGLSAGEIIRIQHKIERRRLSKIKDIVSPTSFDRFLCLREAHGKKNSKRTLEWIIHLATNVNPRCK